MEDGSAAAAIVIEGEHFDFHGYPLFVSRELKCQFCSRARLQQESPVVSLTTQRGDEGVIRVHAQMTVCSRHLRELAQLAESKIESRGEQGKRA